MAVGLVRTLACAGFIVFTKQYAILQSKTQIADYLANKTALENMAVLVTIESAISFGFCVLALRNHFGKKTHKKGLLLHWYPSLTLFPVLFFVLTQAIFNQPGTDFDLIGWVVAGLVLFAFPLAAEAVRQLFPEYEFRLEVHFLLSLFVCILGLLTTVNGNVTYAAASEPIDVHPMAWILGLFLTTFLLGYGSSKLKWRVGRRKKRL